MSNVMIKKGGVDNIATFQHICDTVEDMSAINPKEINLGSICLVVDGDDGIEIYIANSKKQWKLLSSVGGDSSGDDIPAEPVTADSIDEALASDEAEVKIKLTDDLTLNKIMSVDSGKTVEFDLNGNNITTSTRLFNVNGGTLVLSGEGEVNASSNIANVTNGGKVVVNGGTYDSTANNYGFGAIGVGSSIEFNNGELTTTEGGLMAFDGGSITFNGGTLNTRDNFAIGTNGSSGRGGNVITMNGGTINAAIKSNGYEAIGVYLPNDDTFIMNNGTINVTEGSGIVQRGGTCLIRGGSITATGTPGTTGWVGDNKTKMSKSGVIFHQTANYPAKDTMRLQITGGTITGVDHSIEILSDAEKPNVSITGGTFSPAYPEV